MQKRDHRRGMTLLEVAIVLGIIGVVVGAIWVASGAVRQRYDVEEAVETVTQIADRTRALYRAYPGTPHYPTSLTTEIKAGLFPEHIVLNDTTTRNRWGGEVKVGFKRYNNWIVGFGISMELPITVSPDVRNAICAEMVSRMPGSGGYDVAVGTHLDAPMPSTYPINKKYITPGDGPVFVYVGSGGWENVTNRSPIYVANYLRTNDCRKFGFYFRL